MQPESSAIDHATRFFLFERVFKEKLYLAEGDFIQPHSSTLLLALMSKTLKFGLTTVYNIKGIIGVLSVVDDFLMENIGFVSGMIYQQKYARFFVSFLL